MTLDYNVNNMNNVTTVNNVNNVNNVDNSRVANITVTNYDRTQPAKQPTIEPSLGLPGFPTLPSIPSSGEANIIQLNTLNLTPAQTDNYQIKQIQVGLASTNETGNTYSIHHNRTGTPLNFKRDIYHTKNNSLDIENNHLIRSKLLDAQFLMDSNASGVSNWSNLSGISGKTGHSSRPSDEIFTLGFINTDGNQVRSLYDYLQRDIKEAFSLDLNAVPSRSSSMTSIKQLTINSHKSNSLKGRISRMASKDMSSDYHKDNKENDNDNMLMSGLVFHDNQASDTLSAAGTPFDFNGNTTYTPVGSNAATPLQLENVNSKSNHALATFSGHVNSFKHSGVAIIDENNPQPPQIPPEQVTDEEKSSAEKASLQATNSKSHTHSTHTSSSNQLNQLQPSYSNQPPTKRVTLENASSRSNRSNRSNKSVSCKSGKFFCSIADCLL